MQYHLGSNRGPKTPASLAVFSFKYAQRGETWRDVCNRVGAVLADGDSHYRAFREIMLDGKFVPAGRILTTLGTSKRTTPYNCFVSGSIEDNLNDRNGIMQRLCEASETLRRGGGIGYDFSGLRPRGDTVRSLNSRASGPVSYLELYDGMGKTISSSGERRGAQMGVLRVDHPDIEEFISAKQNTDKLSTFNLSIAVTDDFMEAVREGRDFPLQFENRVYRHIDAQVLWETIMRSTWDWGEPGVIFIDRVNKLNNLSYCEEIRATNPCSEQPLPPHGACLLGSFNITRYLMPGGPGKRWTLNLQGLAADVSPVVRAMDNVVDAALYPLEEQKKAAASTRRMGIGVMGVANALEACGAPYGSQEYIELMDNVLACIKNEAYLASSELAKEKGPFPSYDPAQYNTSPFVQGLRHDVKVHLEKYGIRNSHLTSIAPTGTLSFLMDNISSGIEPVFAVASQRPVRMPSGLEVYEVVDYGKAAFGVEPKTAMMVEAQEHISVLAAAQKHIDSAVSKTCNVPSSMPWTDFKHLYIQAWETGAKSCTTFQDGGKRMGLLKAQPDKDCEGGRCAA